MSESARMTAGAECSADFHAPSDGARVRRGRDSTGPIAAPRRDRGRAQSLKMSGAQAWTSLRRARNTARHAPPSSTPARAPRRRRRKPTVYDLPNDLVRRAACEITCRPTVSVRARGRAMSEVWCARPAPETRRRRDLVHRLKTVDDDRPRPAGAPRGRVPLCAAARGLGAHRRTYAKRPTRGARCYAARGRGRRGVPNGGPSARPPRRSRRRRAPARPRTHRETGRGVAPAERLRRCGARDTSERGKKVARDRYRAPGRQMRSKDFRKGDCYFIW